MVGIYAPNGAKEKVFYKEISNKLHLLVYSQLVMMGDFNGITESQTDKIRRKEGRK